MNLLLAGSFDAAERESWRAQLAQAMPQHRLFTPDDPCERPTIEVAVVANPPPGALRDLPALRLIQSLWAGVDRLLADDTLPRTVPIARMVDPALAAAMGQTASWAVLSLHRGFFGYQEQQRRALWRALPQRRADEVRVSVLGCGAMGQACMQALSCHGYRITAWSREASVRPVPAGVQHMHGAGALQPCLQHSDIVLNLLPLTPATRGLLDARFFAALPAGAAVVNLGRGAHVADADLLAALDSGHLAHAVLDVFDPEPLLPAHPYWRHPKVTVLPHVAALTDPRSAAQMVAANVQALVSGRALAHRVDRARGY